MLIVVRYTQASRVSKMVFVKFPLNPFQAFLRQDGSLQHKTRAGAPATVMKKLTWNIFTMS
jgi:hypothetical protein